MPLSKQVRIFLQWQRNPDIFVDNDTIVSNLCDVRNNNAQASERAVQH